MTRIALFAPNRLDSDELSKVFEFMYDVIDDTHISVLFYRTIDLDIVRFFLELPEEYSKHLTIHLPGSLYDLEDQGLIEGVKFLSSNGTEVIEHLYTNANELVREEYDSILKQMIINVDEVFVFYKRDRKQISKLTMPFNYSKKYKKLGYINHLDKNNQIEIVSYQ
ncbi:hypothetical protein AAGG74_18765 [Bacillus mexicanus]|uniref:hypothetical protein n=1 Tax=Bacillus mexicanus TaxID=2834415 RepID=UPI003D1A231F